MNDELMTGKQNQFLVRLIYRHGKEVYRRCKVATGLPLDYPLTWLTKKQASKLIKALLAENNNNGTT